MLTLDQQWESTGMTNKLTSIKRRLPHDAMCSSRYQVGEGLAINGKPAPHFVECNCPRRDLTAYLERLEKPTDKMLMCFGHEWITRQSRGCYDEMLKAAEEDLP